MTDNQVLEVLEDDALRMRRVREMQRRVRESRDAEADLRTRLEEAKKRRRLAELKLGALLDAEIQPCPLFDRRPDPEPEVPAEEPRATPAVAQEDVTSDVASALGLAALGPAREPAFLDQEPLTGSRKVAEFSVRDQRAALWMLPSGKHWVTFDARAFGNWDRNDLASGEYWPTTKEVATAASGWAGYPLVDAEDWGPLGTSVEHWYLALDCFGAAHPEPWRSNALEWLPERWVGPLRKIGVRCFGDLAARLECGNLMALLSNSAPKKPIHPFATVLDELLSQARGWWKQNSASGRKGQFPDWLPEPSVAVPSSPAPKKARGKKGQAPANAQVEAPDIAEPTPAGEPAADPACPPLPTLARDRKAWTDQVCGPAQDHHSSHELKAAQAYVRWQLADLGHHHAVRYDLGYEVGDDTAGVGEGTMWTPHRTRADCVADLLEAALAYFAEGHQEAPKTHERGRVAMLAKLEKLGHAGLSAHVGTGTEQPQPADNPAPCAKCKAVAGEACKNYKGQRKQTCPDRGKPAREATPTQQSDLFGARTFEVEVAADCIVRVDQDEARGIFEAESVSSPFGTWPNPAEENPTPTEKDVAAAISAELGSQVEVAGVNFSCKGNPTFGLRRVKGLVSAEAMHNPGGEGPWRPVGVSGQFPDRLAAALVARGISTLGDLADFLASGKRLQDLEGIGERIAALIAGCFRAIWASGVELPVPAWLDALPQVPERSSPEPTASEPSRFAGEPLPDRKDLLNAYLPGALGGREAGKPARVQPVEIDLRFWVVWGIASNDAGDTYHLRPLYTPLEFGSTYPELCPAVLEPRTEREQPDLYVGLLVTIGRKHYVVGPRADGKSVTLARTTRKEA